MQIPYSKFGNDVALIWLGQDALAKSILISLNLREVPSRSEGHIIGNGDTKTGYLINKIVVSSRNTEVLLGVTRTSPGTYHNTLLCLMIPYAVERWISPPV